jgi:hypothetical protein
MNEDTQQPTPRDLTAEIIAEADEMPQEGEVIRKLVVPQQPSESDDDGDRSPTI